MLKGKNLLPFFWKLALLLILLFFFLSQYNSLEAKNISPAPKTPSLSKQEKAKKTPDQEKGQIEEKTKLDRDIEALSKELGHLIKKEIDSLGIDCDFSTLVHAIQETQKEDKETVSTDKIREKIAYIKNAKAEKRLEEGKKEALAFMDENKKDPSIHELIPNMLQYKTLKKGEGEKVHTYSSPLITYEVKLLDGTSLLSCEETLPLHDAIDAFKKGLVGMKKNEVRTFYVHPDIGFIDKKLIPDGNVLTLEVKILETDHIAKNDSSFEIQEEFITSDKESKKR